MSPPFVAVSPPLSLRGASWLAPAVAFGILLGCSGPAHDGLELRRRLALEVGSARQLAGAVTVRPGELSDRGPLGAGWGDPELSPGRGTGFSWVTARSAWLELEHSGVGPATVTVRGWPFHYEGATEQRLTVATNGVESLPACLPEGEFEVALAVPQGALRTGLNRLELRFDRAKSPVEKIPGATDQRTLAAAILEIRLATTGADEDVESLVVADGEDLLVSPGAVAVFTVRPPRDAVLAVENGRAAAGRAWLRRSGHAAPAVLELSGPGRGAKLGGGQDQPVEIGLEGGERGVRWLRPAIWVPEGSPPVANVVLIVVDTLRADFVGAYGGPIMTPAMDRLAARGVLFERAWSHIPITGPSHASIFTARLPVEHGVHNNSQLLPEGAFTLAESMAASGRSTAAVVSLGVLRSAFGFGRGFDHYGDSFGLDWMKDASEVNDEVLAWLANVGEAPFFLFAHYCDPHEPYAPPDQSYPRIVVSKRGEEIGEMPADGRTVRLPLELAPGATVLRFELDGERPELGFRFPTLRVSDPEVELEPLGGWLEHEKRFGPAVLDSALPARLRLVNRSSRRRIVELDVSCKEKLTIPEIRQRYAEEVAFVDARIGELLEALEVRGLLDNTLVVLTSDHGEGLGDHNHIGHISQLYDSLVRIPLVLSMPGTLPEGLRVAGPAALVDLFPTLAELLAVSPPLDPHGISLLPQVRGEARPRPVIAETYRPESASDKTALIEYGHKLIRSESDERTWEELYHLEADPGELHDLIELDPERVLEMGRRLEELLEAAAADGLAVPQNAPLTEEERAQLRALGYLR